MGCLGVISKESITAYNTNSGKTPPTPRATIRNEQQAPLSNHKEMPQGYRTYNTKMPYPRVGGSVESGKCRDLSGSLMLRVQVLLSHPYTHTSKEYLLSKARIGRLLPLKRVVREINMQVSPW